MKSLVALLCLACNTMPMLMIDPLSFTSGFHVLSGAGRDMHRKPFAMMDNLFQTLENRMNKMMRHHSHHAIESSLLKLLMNKPHRISPTIIVETIKPITEEVIEVVEPVEAAVEKVEIPEEVVSVVETVPAVPEVKIEEQIVAEEGVEKTTEVGDYAKCLEILEQIFNTCNAIKDAIEAQAWEKLLPLSLTLAEQVYADYNCWTHPSQRELLQKFVTAFVQAIKSLADVPECAIQHLRDAAKDLKTAIKLLVRGHAKEASEYLNKAIEALEDIKN